MNGGNKSVKSGFPDPMASREERQSQDYGLRYAKAIETQWGKVNEKSSVYGKRNEIFERNRDYANGTQDTSIYKKLLRTLDPNSADGSLLNLDFTTVPVLPKFVRIVVNKIINNKLYPNLEAVDPVSMTNRDNKKKRLMNQVAMKDQLMSLKQETGGLVLDMDPEELPDTTEEAEILFDTTEKNAAEISAQVSTSMTLEWNDFHDSVYSRCVNDLAACGMAVVKRSNDPNYGIKLNYVDPSMFVHSYTDDPFMNDLTYAGHIRSISISELRRLAGDEISDDDLDKIMKTATHRDPKERHNYYHQKIRNDEYDEYMVQVMDFEFKAVETMFFQERDNRYGNTGFYFEGFNNVPKAGSVFERRSHSMQIETVYGGTYIIGAERLFGYGVKSNIPKNIHDLSKAELSYSAVCTNMRRNMPKSMVDGCIGYADMLQITHLKIQQAIAKAKPDGLVIDIEGLENVQLGKAGELQPLDLHDIYEQTGVFYYRSKNPEGGFQNPPVREIGNSIRNINELIALYNHYLRMIRDTTGINEVVDASSPKTDALVGVQQQAIQASNNATFDITNSALVLFKKVCSDVVKSIQILPPESVIYQSYMSAIGESNMDVAASFAELPMHNFGVVIQKDMEEKERVYLEQNIQMALSQKELDIEDAIAIRNLKDINQAERLLVIRRKRRTEKNQQMILQQQQQQAQLQQQQIQLQAQVKQQEAQVESQLEAQRIQLQSQADIAVAQARHEMQKELEVLKSQVTGMSKQGDQVFRSQLENFKENRKDERVKKQAEEQSKLIEQRKGTSPGFTMLNDLI